MTVSCLIDNDIVIKLSRMDVWIDGLAAVQLQPSQVGSFRSMLRYMGITDSAKRLAHAGGDQNKADRLAQALCSVVELEATPQEATAAIDLMKFALENDLDLDQGELLLFVVAMIRGGLDVLTGDKRAIRNLPMAETHTPLLSTLRKRVVCLEQIFKCLCKAQSFQRVRKAVITCPTADSTISFAYQHSDNDAAKFLGFLDLVLTDHIEQPAPNWLKAV